MKKHKFLLKTAVAFLIFIGISLYAYNFPSTMKLLDENINKLIYPFYKNTEISLFEDFSDVTKSIFDRVLYYVEIVKDNIKETEKTERKIPFVIISCAGKFPAEKESVTSFFGKRKDPFSKKEDSHSGIDIAADFGSEIIASWPGTIYKTGFDDIYGNFIVIKHSEEFFTKYCHLSKISSIEKSFVNAGEKIGEAGSTGRSTGNHLHFEVIVEGKNIDPLLCLEL